MGNAQRNRVSHAPEPAAESSVIDTRWVRAETAQCGWWPWGAVELRGKAGHTQSQVVLGAGHTRASLGANWAMPDPGSHPSIHGGVHANQT